MTRECGIYVRLEKCIQGFGGGDLRERNNLEDLSVNGRTRRLILTWIFKKWDGGDMDWINVAQDMALVSVVMCLQVL